MIDIYHVSAAAVIEGAEVVFHMAAPDSSINNHMLHYSVNVLGKYFLTSFFYMRQIFYFTFLFF